MNRIVVQFLVLVVTASTALGGPVQRNTTRHTPNETLTATHTESTTPVVTVTTEDVTKQMATYLADEMKELDEQIQDPIVLNIKQMATYVADEIKELNKQMQDPVFLHNYGPSILGVAVGISAFMILVCLRRCCLRRREPKRYRTFKLSGTSDYLHYSHPRRGESTRLVPRSRFDEDSDNH